MRYVIKISVVALLLGACGYSENEEKADLFKSTIAFG